MTIKKKNQVYQITLMEVLIVHLNIYFLSEQDDKRSDAGS